MRWFLYNAAGTEWEMPAPMEVTLQRDEAAPADSLTLRCPLAETPDETAIFCRVEENNCIWFDGITDTLCQTAGTARLLTVTARTRVGLLLDSEALPALYLAPSLSGLWRQHAAPYGFAEIVGNRQSFHTPLRVEKGSSEWQVLAGFCRDYLGTSLRLRDGSLTAAPPVELPPLVLGGTGGPCLQLTNERRVSRLLSEAWGMRNGAWQMQQQMEQVKKLGLLRRRLCTNPCTALENSTAAAQTVTVLCPDWLTAELGQQVRLNWNGRVQLLRVVQLRYRLAAQGKTTRLLLQTD